MFKTTLTIISIIFSLLMMTVGILLIAFGLGETLDIIKSINEDLYYYVIFVIFGLSSFSLGIALISEFTSQKK